MKLKVKRTELLKKIVKLERIIDSHGPLPALKTIKFDLQDVNTIELTSSNSDISIRTHIFKDDINMLDIQAIGVIGLDAKLVTKILKSLDSEMITFESLDDNKNIIRIKGGKSQYDINGLDASDYPNIIFENEDDHYFSLDTNEFITAVENTMYCCFTQETQPIFTGVNIVSDGACIQFLATDKHRLAQRVINKSIDAFNVVIPKKSIADVLKTISDCNEMNMCVKNNYVIFKTNDDIIRCRLIEGTFPDTQRLIPTQFVTTVKIECDTLYAALERASLLDDENKISLQMNKDIIQLLSNAQQIGHCEETIDDFIFDGEDLNIYFDSMFLKDALRTRKGQDILISFSGELRPFVITSLDNKEDGLELILPMRHF